MDNQKQKIKISEETFKGLQDELAKMVNLVFDELCTSKYQKWFIHFMKEQSGVLRVKQYLEENSKISELEYHNLRALNDLPEMIDKLSTEQKIPNGSWRINETMNYNIQIYEEFYNLIVQKKESTTEIILQTIKPTTIYVKVPVTA